MVETKKDRVKRMQSAGIETNDMIDRQFISDKNLSECIREVQILFDKWKLRPLERDIVIMMVGKYEKDRRLSQKQRGLFDNLLGKTLERFGSMK